MNTLLPALRVWLFAFVALGTFWGAQAQNCHTPIKGRVLDARSNEPLGFASVWVRSESRHTLCDADGRFVLDSFCRGQSYLLEADYLGATATLSAVAGGGEYLIRMETDAVLSEVVVAEKAVEAVHTETVCVVDKLDFDSKQAISLSEIVRQLPGVNVLQTGANIAKPMIQGLHSNRIVIVNNNQVLEGQQWGREHAPEIDPFSADRVTVVKGAMGVRYGVGAMAGAIVLEPAPLRATPGWGGWATLGAFTNGRSGVAAAALDYRAPNRPWAVRIQGAAKRGGNLRAPDYFLHNTGHAELNFSALAEWKPNERTTHELALSRFSQQLGILRASHLGSTEQIELAAQLDTPLNNINRFTWAIDRPYQGIQHYSAIYKLQHRINDYWKIRAQYGFQYNYRLEYDVVRRTGAAADRAQVAFQLWTNSADLWVEHRARRYWQGEGGVQLIHFLNNVNRGAFIPNFQTWGASVWAHERWRKHDVPWELEIGARYDIRHSHAYTTGNAGRDINRYVTFGNISGIGGVHYHLGHDITLTLHSGYAWRPPSMYELFARGVHHGAGIYEEGDSLLVPEKSWNTNLSFNYRPEAHPDWLVSITLYRNQIRDFIYLDPSRTSKITIRGPFPAYFYKQADAVLQGMDAQINMPIKAGFGAEVRASLIRAHRKTGSGASETGTDPLPLMPSDRYQYGISWKSGSQNGPQWRLRLMANTVLEQRLIPAVGLIKDPPPGFTTFAFDASRTWVTKNNRSWEAGVSLQNLTNERYREYLNFFRFYADEPGFNAGFRLKFIF